MADKRRIRRNSGFTLMEIIFAILILGGSLTVLLGLQSSSTQRNVRDKNKQQALLVAREIMSVIESTPIPVDIQDFSGPPRELISSLYPEALEQGREIDPENRLIAQLKVEFWPLPNIDDPEAVKRITLRIYWSDSPLDQIELVYFEPNEPA
ncbi:MAG: hypothetical protein DCC75_11970 [Proteobacteria bacterium]|nr:MAG: hypothetical protein DCC75_11970 [Pseudomonadota bacterium]